MNRRIRRVNVLLRRELSRVLAQEMKDPRLKAMVSITRVETSADLRHARVGVSVLGTAEEKGEVLSLLNGAAGFLRRGLGQRVTLKAIPQLHFFLDDSIEEGARLLEVLDRLAREEGE